jgi:ABC-type dipeptide/oligopeptide/nickel transport system ATPase component
MTSASQAAEQPVLEANNLRTYFQTRWGIAKGVDWVSFHLTRGETLGIVGKWGSGSYWP